MTVAEVEAANWQALARYHHALTAPRAVTSRCQEALIGELTRNALAFAGPGDDQEPDVTDVTELLREAIAVLAQAMGEPGALAGSRSDPIPDDGRNHHA